MNVGFTGTRRGMTPRQAAALRQWLATPPQPITTLYHGAAVGADEQAVILFDRPADTFAFPASDVGDRLVSQEALRRSGTEADPSPALERNALIASRCDVLLAAPHGPEERRSGTWHCVRQARRLNKRVVVFWPDGTVADDTAD